MAYKKSDEYDIRSHVVRKLIKEGWDRGNIRIEIPLSTASHGGRVDLVCLADDYIGSVELKSGKDKLESDLLKDQIKKYERAFDYCGVIADQSLYKSVRTTTAGGGYSERNNFQHVDIAYYHHPWQDKYCFKNHPDRETTQHNIDTITPILFPHTGRSSKLTCSYDMACVLWADELRKIFKSSKGTKWFFEQQVREEFGAKEFRPLMIEALRSRPLNDWEKKFWEKMEEKNGR